MVIIRRNFILLYYYIIVIDSEKYEMPESAQLCWIIHLILLDYNNLCIMFSSLVNMELILMTLNTSFSRDACKCPSEMNNVLSEYKHHCTWPSKTHYQFQLIIISVFIINKLLEILWTRCCKFSEDDNNFFLKWWLKSTFI